MPIGAPISVVPMRFGAALDLSVATARGRTFDSPFPYSKAPCCSWAMVPGGNITHPAVASIQRSLAALGFTDAAGASSISGVWDPKTHAAYTDAALDVQPFGVREKLGILGVPPMDPERAAILLKDAVLALPRRPRPEPPVRAAAMTGTGPRPGGKPAWGLLALLGLGAYFLWWRNGQGLGFAGFTAKTRTVRLDDSATEVVESATRPGYARIYMSRAQAERGLAKLADASRFAVVQFTGGGAFYLALR